MTTIPPLPPEAEEAHRAIAQKAAALLGEFIDGNGLKAEQARLSRQEVRIVPLPAAMTVTVTHDVARRVVQGGQPQGIVLGTEGEVMAQVTGSVHALLEGEDTQRAIIQALEKIPGNGFGSVDGVTVPLALKKEFSVVSPCPRCNGAAMVPCQLCHATGQENCMTCRGEGSSPCQTCFGVGMVQNSQGVRTPCLRCQSSGRIPCVVCQGMRTMVCSACHGQRQVGCAECAKTGHQTVLYQVSYKAQCQFGIAWGEVTDAEARPAAEALGLKALATEKHADILWHAPEVQGDRMVIPCIAFLPLADVEFSLVGKMYPALVAGLRGRIIRMESALDPLVKPGISALMKLSKGPMAVQALIDTACRYKMIRGALAGLVRSSKRTVYQALVKEYPVVLSDKYARATVTYAHQALLSITAKPRNKGLVAGTVLTAAPAAVYYHLPLRQTLATGALGAHIGLVDIIVWLAGWGLAVFVIKWMAAGALQRLLPRGAQSSKASLPPSGNQGLAALATTAVIMLAVAATAAVKPDWAQHLLAAFGIRL